MQTLNLLLQEPRVTNTNGSVVAILVNSIDQHFWFTGFGPNPDPNKILPVAGGYDKFRYRPFNGTTRYFDVYQGNQVYFWEESGVSSEANSQLLNYATYDKLARCYNECLTKLYDEIREHEANLALSIGEARETGRMFKAFKSVESIIQSARQIRRKLKTNPSLLASEMWLQWKYGIKPLVSDVYSYVDWTYRTFWERDFKARRRITEKINDVFTYSGYNNNLKGLIRGARVNSCEIGLSAGLVDNDWFNASRITSMNPLTVAWELTTLSFVFDWFIDVGGYLTNLENALGQGLAFRHGYVTEVNRVELTEEAAGVDRQYYGANSFTERSTFLTATLYRCNKSRVVLGDFPFPRAPTLNLKLGAQRMLSAGALLRTIVLGDVKGRRW